MPGLRLPRQAKYGDVFTPEVTPQAMLNLHAAIAAEDITRLGQEAAGPSAALYIEEFDEAGVPTGERQRLYGPQTREVTDFLEGPACRPRRPHR